MEQHQLSLLHEHYKETYDYIQKYLQLRDRLFAYLLVVITIMMFQLYSPADSAGVVSELFNKNLQLSTPIDISFLSSIIWFLLLTLVVRYYQTVVHIERQYGYIHTIEDLLTREFGGIAFTREGKSYLRDYPIFSSWAWILYTILFPTLLSAIVVVKIVGEIKNSDNATALLGINLFIAICVLLSEFFYVLLIHFKK